MTIISRFSISGFRAKLAGTPLLRSYGAVVGTLFSGNTNDEKRSVFLALIRTMLGENGEISEERIEIVRRLIEEKRGTEEAFRQAKKLLETPEITAEDAAGQLKDLPEEHLKKLLSFLILLAFTAGVWNEKNQKLLCDFTIAAKLQKEDFLQILETTEKEKQNRDQLIRSGAGILAAIGVIAVFILTATLLRSVIFGLIGAYLLLPLERYFENKLNSRKGFIYRLVCTFELLAWPLNALSRAVRRSSKSGTEDEKKRLESRSITKKAITLTMTLTGMFLVSILIFLTAMTGKYVDKIQATVDNLNQSRSVQTTKNQADVEELTLMEKAEEYIQLLEKKMDTSPVFGRLSGVGKKLVVFVRNALNDENTRAEISGMLLRSTGGVVNFTANLFGTVIAIIGDIVLSIFFCLLFLFKLAEFCRRDDSSGRQSEYLVRTVFNGKWLPGAEEQTIRDARQILNGTFSRLRIWVRGYLLLIAIDATVYTCMFWLLDVPYFPLLGIMAGCGVLLPYIGPILCCTITTLTTLAVGDSSGVQVILLLLFYLLYSGVIEQFILYPAVIGDSLGLTSLETVIVVLLGAVFAGITGMILALPAASVIKFIVPQIYRCLEKNSQVIKHIES